MDPTDDAKLRGDASTESNQPIRFAGSVLGAQRHVCAFFSSRQEEYDTLLPFVRDGLERGERAYHVLPSQYREEHLAQLRSGGINVAGAPNTQQLPGGAAPENAFRGGGLNQDALLAPRPTE